MLLGAMWPSLFTFFALVGLPVLVVCLVALVVPKILRRSLVRWYAILALGLAVGATAIEVGWLAIARCRDLNIIVPDGFTGTVSLVRDSNSGLELAAVGYIVHVPATGQVAARYNALQCYSVNIKSTSGQSLRFRDLGTLAGRKRMGKSYHFSSEFDGTTLQWVVE